MAEMIAKMVAKRILNVWKGETGSVEVLVVRVAVAIVLGCSAVVVVADADDDGEKNWEMDGSLYTFP
jgi:hypothetical protein